MNPPPADAPIDEHQDYLRWLQMTAFRPHLRWIRNEMIERTEARINNLKSQAPAEQPPAPPDDDLPF